MPFTLTDDQRTALTTAAARERRVRRWKRARAILLRGEGLSVPAVAQTLGCSQASIYAWSAPVAAGGSGGTAGR